MIIYKTSPLLLHYSTVNTLFPIWKWHFYPPKIERIFPSHFIYSLPIQSNEATLYTLWCLSFPLPNFSSPTNIPSITNLNTTNVITLDQTSTSSYLNISPSSTHYHIPKLPPFLRPSHPTILYFGQHQFWLGGTWRGLGTHNTIVGHPVPLPLLYHAFLQWCFGHLVPRSFTFCRGVAPLCSVRKALVILNKALGACWLFPRRTPDLYSWLTFVSE